MLFGYESAHLLEQLTKTRNLKVAAVPIANGKLVKELLDYFDISKEQFAEAALMKQDAVDAVLNSNNVSHKVLMQLMYGLNQLPDVNVSPEELMWEEVGEAKDQTSFLNLANEIPQQSAIIRFGISENSKLTLVPTGVENNDYDTIEAFRDELLDTGGPIDSLLEAYSVRNVPQAELYLPLLERYRAELSKDARQVNYTRLYAIGSRIMAARKKAQLEEDNGEWPVPGPLESEAMDSICSLHGPLIMASEAGRKLVVDAHQFETTPEVYRKEEALISEFGAKLAEDSDIFEKDTSDAIIDINGSNRQRHSTSSKSRSAAHVCQFGLGCACWWGRVVLRWRLWCSSSCRGWGGKATLGGS